MLEMLFGLWNLEVALEDIMYVRDIKLVVEDVVYGFTYNIEVPKSQCFHTEDMADHCAEVWNKKLDDLEEKSRKENKELEERMRGDFYV